MNRSARVTDRSGPRSMRARPSSSAPLPNCAATSPSSSIAHRPAALCQPGRRGTARLRHGRLRRAAAAGDADGPLAALCAGLAERLRALCRRRPSRRRAGARVRRSRTATAALVPVEVISTIADRRRRRADVPWSALVRDCQRAARERRAAAPLHQHAQPRIPHAAVDHRRRHPAPGSDRRQCRRADPPALPQDPDGGRPPDRHAGRLSVARAHGRDRRDRAGRTRVAPRAAAGRSGRPGARRRPRSRSVDMRRAARHACAASRTACAWR